MSFVNAVSINSPADAFDRIRTSTAYTLFDSQLQYDLSPLLMESVLTGTGTATHLPNEASCLLTVAANGDQVIRQSHGYFRYQPGKSQFIATTFVFGAPVANVRRRAGYFDSQNGLFLEQTVTGPKIVRRTFTSGAAVDNAIAQANWNIDKFDGSGPSGEVLDLSKIQILVIDLQWLGGGRVRVGFYVSGVIYYAHEFFNTNILTTVYMSTANLPVRYEITAMGAPGGAQSMRQICVTVVSEGGFEAGRGFPFTASTDGTSATVTTTRRPVLSIRPKLLYNGLTNRTQINMDLLEAMAGTGNAFFELLYQPTLTGAVWNSVDVNSTVEFDVSATAVSGGTRLESGFWAAGTATTRVVFSRQIVSRLAIALNVLGTVADIVSVVATSLAGNVPVNATLDWVEIR